MHRLGGGRITEDGDTGVVRSRAGALTIGWWVVGPRLGVGGGGLAGEGLLEASTEAGREAVGGGIPKASRHAQRASRERGYDTHGPYRKGRFSITQECARTHIWGHPTQTGANKGHTHRGRGCGVGFRHRFVLPFRLRFGK